MSLDSNESRLFFICTAFVAAMLIFVPLLYGGNRPLPQLVVELAALGMFSLLLLCTQLPSNLPRSLLVLALAVLVLPLFQLIPVPTWLWEALPGRDFYAEALNEVLPEQSVDGFRQITLTPLATELGLYALFPAFAIILVISRLPSRYVLYCVYVFLFMAFIQAALTLIQSSTGISGVGTYANRNHLSGMLVIALPIVFGLISSRIGKSNKHSHRLRSPGFFRRSIEGISNIRGMNTIMLLGMCAILISLGVIFSRSRTGIAVMMLGFFLAALFFGRLMGKAKSIQVSGVILVAVATLAIEVGLAPVIARFSVESTVEDARWLIFSHVYEGLKVFFPLGSGIGGFPEVFRRFQPEAISGFVNHAHNGYLEYIFEGGVFSLGIIFGFFVMYIARWFALLKQDREDIFYYVQVGAGISVLLLGVHEFFDFNMHIPANNLYFAFVVAIFFYQFSGVAEFSKKIALKQGDAQVLKLKVLESKSNPFS